MEIQKKYTPHPLNAHIWLPEKTSVVDIKALLGTIINMGLHPLLVGE